MTIELLCSCVYYGVKILGNEANALLEIVARMFLNVKIVLLFTHALKTHYRNYNGPMCTKKNSIEHVLNAQN